MAVGEKVAMAAAPGPTVEKGAAAADELLMMPRATALRIAFFAVASGLLFGVDLGSIGGAMNAMEEELDLSTIQVEGVVSGAKGGAIFGCLVGGALMQRYGRRNTVAMSLLPFFGGPVLIGFARNFGEALAGRLLVGIGIGIASASAPCFLSEVSPAPVRGAVVALYELAIAMGFFIASLVTYFIETVGDGDHLWRFQAGFVPFATALPLLLACSLVPESPRWLLKCAGGDVQLLRGALQAMTALGCKGARERLQSASSAEGGEGSAAASELPMEPTPSWPEATDEIVALWDKQHQASGAPLLLSPAAAAARPSALTAAPKKSSVFLVLWETLKDIGDVVMNAERVPPGTRHGLLLAVLAAILTQVCASTSVLVYSQHLLKEVGVSNPEVQDALSITVAAAKMLGVAIGVCIVNKVGRRALMGWGGVLSAVMLTVLTIGNASANVALLLLGMCLFILFYCATWGLGYWVVVTEVTAVGGPRITESCQAAATAVMFAAGWFTSLTFASLMQAGGPWALFTYAGVAVLMALYSWGMLPETRGHTLEELAVLIAQRSLFSKRAPKAAEQAPAVASSDI